MCLSTAPLNVHCGSGQALAGATSARSGLDAALRDALLEARRLDGVAEVRLLPRDRRAGRDVPKAFVVLATHDLERDQRVVNILSQMLEIDYDLVPAESAGMIPDGARRV